jgi:hypothetical protein
MESVLLFLTWLLFLNVGHQLAHPPTVGSLTLALLQMVHRGTQKSKRDVFSRDFSLPIA